jgi:putative membrane protein
MILRDYLAMDRTVLANQRTILAYFRTFIGLIAAGIGIIKLTDETVLIIIGWIFVLLSPAVLAVGVVQYRKYRHKYSNELYR